MSMGWFVTLCVLATLAVVIPLHILSERKDRKREAADEARWNAEAARIAAAEVDKSKWVPPPNSLCYCEECKYYAQNEKSASCRLKQKAVPAKPLYWCARAEITLKSSLARGKEERK